MSSAILLARFPDGTVCYGVYDGTSDTCLPFLEATGEEAVERYKTLREHGFWEAWEAIKRVRPEDVEAVELATEYGFGYAWQGRATRHTLVDGLDPFVGSYTNGLPCWAKAATNE